MHFIETVRAAAPILISGGLIVLAAVLIDRAMGHRS